MADPAEIARRLGARLPPGLACHVNQLALRQLGAAVHARQTQARRLNDMAKGAKELHRVLRRTLRRLPFDHGSVPHEVEDRTVAQVRAIVEQGGGK